MTWGLVTSAGAGLVGGLLQKKSAESAADKAAEAQKGASEASIAEARRQFDSVQSLLSPYTMVGQGALVQQQSLLGLGGEAAQKNAIAGIAGGAQMQALTQQGENAILQNAAATGGLRGGNTQGALAQFRPQILNQLIQQQYSNLGGLASLGQNAAAGVGNAGQAASNQIINALQQQGNAGAANALARGQAGSNLWGGLGSTASMLGTLKLLGKY